MVRDPARRGHRGDPRRGLQPHRRGQPPGPDAVACAASTTPAYYRLVEDDPRYYMDYTGTGNSLNVRNPHTLQLIMDSLRYWVTEMHVDGFRFDLASTLAREFYDVDRLSAFFDLVQQDPVVSQVKLIAEPWDVGPGGYQVGNFPPLWTRVERQVPRHRARLLARRAGHPRRVRLPAHRLAPTSTRTTAAARRVSINFVTAHDGFTLRRPGRLQRQAQRGQRRGQQRRREPQPLLELRRRGPHRRRRRSSRCGPGSSATSSPRCCSRQGVPMMLHGDELGRTQHGNNNVYCQDNELPGSTGTTPTSAAARVHPAAHRAARTAPGVPAPPLLRRPPVARPRRRASPLPDIAWFTPDGEEMTERGLGLRLRQRRWRLPQRRGHPRGRPARPAPPTTRSCCCFNAHHEPLELTLPGREYGERWERGVDTASRRRCAHARSVGAGRHRSRVPRPLRPVGLLQRTGVRTRRARPDADAPPHLPAAAPPGFGFDDVRCSPLPADARRRRRSTLSPLLAADARLDARLRRGRPRAVDPRARAASRPAAAGRARSRARAGVRARHRAQPHGRRRSAGTPGGGTCCGTGRRRRTPVLRHRLGRAGRLLLPVLGADEDAALGELELSTTGRAALLRARASRWPPGTGDGGTARRCTTRSTTGWSPGGAAPPS